MQSPIHGSGSYVNSVKRAHREPSIAIVCTFTLTDTTDGLPPIKEQTILRGNHALALYKQT